MAVSIGPEEAIARIDDWKGKDVSFVVLSGGITNHNYTVTVNGGDVASGGGKFVLRIPGDGTEMFINRHYERTAAVAAAKTGVSPQVLYTILPENCMVIPFIEGETMHAETVAGHPERIKPIVEAVKTVHRQATFENDINVFDMVRAYTQMAHDTKASLPAELTEMFAIGDQIEAAMERDKPAPVACHNDLLAENFILAPDGKMWVIDWEYGGMCDPYFDLGDFCAEHPFSEEDERLVLTTYCGEMDEHRYYRMLLYKLMADLWWCIWAMIQAKISKIDFDFHEYGMVRVRRFLRNAQNPDFTKWIAGV